MSKQSSLDQVRGAVLDKIERSERRYKLALWAAVALESCFLVGFLLLADLGNRVHVLVFLAAIGVYSILALGLVALGAHVSRCTERVLKAIDLLARRGSIPSEIR